MLQNEWLITIACLINLAAIFYCGVRLFKRVERLEQVVLMHNEALAESLLSEMNSSREQHLKTLEVLKLHMRVVRGLEDALEDTEARIIHLEYRTAKNANEEPIAEMIQSQARMSKLRRMRTAKSSQE